MTKNKSNKQGVEQTESIVEAPITQKLSEVTEKEPSNITESNGEVQPEEKENTLTVQEPSEGKASFSTTGPNSENKKEARENLDAETQATYQEAKEVITTMVDEVLKEKGIIGIEALGETKAEQCKKIASDVFTKHPNHKVLYFTSDLIPFFEKSDANKHASALPDNTVVTLNKE